MSTQRYLDTVNRGIQKGMAFFDEHMDREWLARIQEGIAKEKFTITSCYSCALALASCKYFDNACRDLALDEEEQAAMGFAAWSATPMREALEELMVVITDDDDVWRLLTLAWEWNIMTRVAGVQP